MPTYKYNVTMTCSGCSGAVNRVLSKMDGVTHIDINMEAQTVTVDTTDAVTKEQVFEKIKKTGKAVTMMD